MIFMISQLRPRPSPIDRYEPSLNINSLKSESCYCQSCLTSCCPGVTRLHSELMFLHLDSFRLSKSTLQAALEARATNADHSLRYAASIILV